MSGTVAARLAELGITLPEVAITRGNYVPVVITGGQAWVAGQVPFLDNELQYVGRVGEDLALEDGQAAARLCFLNILAQLEKALDGDLDRVRRIVKLGGFVIRWSSTAPRISPPRSSARPAAMPASPWARRPCRSAWRWRSTAFSTSTEAPAVTVPVYEYYCPANDRTVEVKHPAGVQLRFWAELCYAAQVPLGETDPEAPVKKRVSAPAVSVSTGNSDLRSLGFTKLVRRDRGVYENVTATGAEARYFRPGDAAGQPDFRRKIRD